MNKLLLILIFTSVSTFAQFRDDGLNQPKVKEGIVDQSSGFAFGFLNSENFQMRHSFSLSYTAFGGQGSQTAFGIRGGATFLSKMTTAAAIIFMITSLSLAIIYSKGSSSEVAEIAEESSVVDEVSEEGSTTDSATETSGEETPATDDQNNENTE